MKQKLNILRQYLTGMDIAKISVNTNIASSTISRYLKGEGTSLELEQKISDEGEKIIAEKYRNFISEMSKF